MGRLIPRAATRCGRPAWENPPQPRRAQVPMRDWLTRHETQPSSLLARLLRKP